MQDGEVYDALYGTDVISESNGAQREGGYNPVRGDKVIAFSKEFLDNTIPSICRYENVINFEFVDSEILMTLSDGKKVTWRIKKNIGYMIKEKEHTDSIQK